MRYAQGYLMLRRGPAGQDAFLKCEGGRDLLSRYITAVKNTDQMQIQELIHHLAGPSHTILHASSKSAVLSSH
jgi:hypothetical protein